MHQSELGHKLKYWPMAMAEVVSEDMGDPVFPYQTCNRLFFIVTKARVLGLAFTATEESALLVALAMILAFPND